VILRYLVGDATRCPVWFDLEIGRFAGYRTMANYSSPAVAHRYRAMAVSAGKAPQMGWEW
jgi:hypothetical protein